MAENKLTAKQATEQKIIDFCAETTRDPLLFARVAYEWGVGDLVDSKGPRQWQSIILDSIGQHIRNPLTRFSPLKIAVSSGHGIGKSALISMVTHWAMSTCVDCKVLITANTERQLLTKTVPELSAWFRRAFNKHWWKVTATAVASIDKEHERTWRMDAIPWSLSSTESFAGLHNKGRRIIVIFDEGSAIEDKIWEVVEGAMTDKDTEIFWIAFGNPTRNSGRFRECFGKFKERWVTKQIDSRTVEGTNLELFKEWEADYSEDSDFFRVRVKGEFPRAGTMQFIPSDLVEAARKRDPEAGLRDPLVIGVDVARFGDDATVICFRRGRDAKSVPWIKLRGADTMQVAARVAQLYHDMRPDQIFIDGGGPGGGVIDRLVQLKVPCMEVQFGAGADRGQVSHEGAVKYANKRAEMWGNMREWLKRGMIPDESELASQLCGLEYGYVMREGQDKVLLESKKDMKKRGLSSPDEADALCFVAGTMIKTPLGETPIEGLQCGDLVLTPFGTSRIMKKWVSETNSITSAFFSDGAHLSGKGAHKIFTWNNSGQTRLDALPLTVEVEPYSKWRRFLWLSASLFFIKARNTGFKTLVDILGHGEKLTVNAFFTGAFMLTISEPYRKVSMSIIKTMTGVTTLFRTLKSNMAQNTYLTIGRSGFLRIAKEIKRIWIRHELRPLNGMAPLPALSGIKSMEKKHGTGESQLGLFVRYAEQRTGHSFQLGQDFVGMHVNRSRVIGDILRVFVPVFSAVKHLLRIAIGLRPVVPVHVQTEGVQPTLVYNLTLKEDNAYYANGILAFNCLTFAYPISESDHRANFTTGGQSGHTSSYNSLDRGYIAKDLSGGINRS